jgi:enamine deaminase RidA (YjgF/YER057c/UK114 family)
VVIYVVCLEDDINMSRAWEAYTDVIGEDGPPATLIGVTMLGSSPDGGPQALVEIESTAVLPA